MITDIENLTIEIKQLKIEDGQDIILYIPPDQINSENLSVLSSALDQMGKDINKDFNFWILPNNYELKVYDKGTLKDELFVGNR